MRSVLGSTCFEGAPRKDATSGTTLDDLIRQRHAHVLGLQKLSHEGSQIGLCSRLQVGATSGKTLDDLIRHAHVLGFNDFTRSDALAAAQYKDELRLYKCAASTQQFLAVAVSICQNRLCVLPPGTLVF